MSAQTTAHEQSAGTGRADPEDGLALIAAVRERSLAAFEELYRLYHPRLSAFLLHILRRPQLVEEVLDDTMMVVWERADTFRGASKLSTWIFAIAYRKARRSFRRAKAPPDDLGADENFALDTGPERTAAHRRTRQLLMEAIDTLSPDHRAVVSLTYFHDLEYREIARIVDCPVETVKTRMFYARRHLRRALGGDLADWI